MGFFFNIIQRINLYYLTENYFDILLLQLFVQISLEVCVLPGQTGINEYITSILYLTIFDTLAIQGMILNRLFIFYLPLLISFILIMINARFLYKSKNEIIKL